MNGMQGNYRDTRGSGRYGQKNSGGYSRNNDQTVYKETPKKVQKLTQENYGELAEQVILELKKKKDRNEKNVPVVTTSKLRNLLAMTAAIYNDLLNNPTERLDSDIIGRINYLKVRFAYEAGRENSVKNLVEEADILAHLDEIKGSRAQFILFSRYMESLVAYRKFYVDKDE